MPFSLAELNEAIAAAVPERECIVHADRRLSWGEMAERTRRLASFLREHGLGRVVRPRSELAGHESGQDHLAIYLYNGPEYLETMVGAFKARVVPFNVNYRYVAEELRYLLRDGRARAIVYHGSFAATLASVRGELPDLQLLIQVDDGSGAPLLPGAVAYEAALAAGDPAPRTAAQAGWSADDLYCIYTGGTTGAPKGVLWRQGDILAAAMGGVRADSKPFASVAEMAERARTSKTGKLRVLAAPPFMHGAAHWSAFATLHGGGTVLIQRDTQRLDPDDVWDTLEREAGNQLLIVGDAFARPLADALRRKPRPLAALRHIVSGGAALSQNLKAELLELLPHVAILDAVGSSETGRQGQLVSARGGEVKTGTFEPAPDNVVLSEDLTHVLPAGSPETGWLAKRGCVPLGYLGDAAKTAKTFPVVDGARFSVPGDRARLRADGTLELLGRDSVTINTGGEKVFAEEVEHALKQHSAVWDAVVVGRPSERWGQEVVALVKLREGSVAAESELLEECARHLARYKLPKAFLFLEEIVRSPSGKADYRWAKERAVAAARPTG